MSRISLRILPNFPFCHKIKKKSINLATKMSFTVILNAFKNSSVSEGRDFAWPLLPTHTQNEVCRPLKSLNNPHFEKLLLSNIGGKHDKHQTFGFSTFLKLDIWENY